jgi:phosphoribosylformylglycinamidine synthase
MGLIHFYRIPALSEAKERELLRHITQNISSVKSVSTEYCFNVQVNGSLDSREISVLKWLLAETFEANNFSEKSFLTDHSSPPSGPPLPRGELKGGIILEVGPRMNFTTAWSTNAVAICNACGLKKITRIERSRRYKFDFTEKVSNEHLDGFYSSLVSRYSSLFFDRMTECPYPEPLSN